MVTIPPYSPWLNPVEKSYFRLKERYENTKAKEGKFIDYCFIFHRCLSLQLIQKSFDKTAKIESKGFIDASRLEWSKAVKELFD